MSIVIANKPKNGEISSKTGEGGEIPTQAGEHGEGLEEHCLQEKQLV